MAADADRVEDRPNTLLRSEKVDETEFGRFGWAMDPEGNRIELWEPVKVELKAEGG